MRWLVPLALVGCAAPFDPELAEALRTALDEGVAATDAPGGSMAVWHAEHGLWEGASGEADRETELAATPDTPFRSGSITKTYTAAALLQLVDEGAVDLDAPLATWLPDAPHAAEVSLRQVMQHTAGYPDYVYDLAFLAERDEAHTADELLAFIDGEALTAPPGTAYAYSNTHYLLAGMVLEALEGADYALVLRERLLTPHALERTWFPTEDGDPPDLARGYVRADGQWLDVTEGLDSTGSGAGGEIAATSADLVHWGRALFGGEVLSDTSTEAMVTPPVIDGEPTPYGLGAYVEEVRGHTAVGHSGSTLGYQSRLRAVHTDAGWIVVAVQVNSLYAEADQIDALAWEHLLP